MLESFLLTEGASFGDSFTNIITLMSSLAGLAIGFASTKVSPKRNFYIASAVLGALFFVVVAVKSGLYFDDVGDSEMALDKYIKARSRVMTNDTLILESLNFRINEIARKWLNSAELLLDRGFYKDPLCKKLCPP